MSGLTEKEQIVMDNFVEAWGTYQKLNPLAEDEKRVFCDGIHVLQRMLLVRIVRRDYLAEWAQK